MGKEIFEDVVIQGEIAVHRTVTINKIVPVEEFRIDLMRGVAKELETPVLPEGTFKFKKSGDSTTIKVYRPSTIMEKRTTFDTVSHNIWCPPRIYIIRCSMSRIQEVKLFYILNKASSFKAVGAMLPNYGNYGKMCTDLETEGSDCGELVSNYIYQDETAQHAHNNDLTGRLDSSYRQLRLDAGVAPEQSMCVTYFTALHKLTEEKKELSILEAYDMVSGVSEFSDIKENSFIRLMLDRYKELSI